MRGSSLNARIAGDSSLIDRIVEGLVELGIAERVEPWRHFGVRVRCAAVEVLLDADDAVTIQVAATRSLNLWQRIAGSVHPDAWACFRVASAVHDLLDRRARWTWDGQPRAPSSNQATIAT